MKTPPFAFLVFCAISTTFLPAFAKDLVYETTNPPLEVTFAVNGGHYSGAVTGGNLFLSTDILVAPLIRWKGAAPGKLYTLLMLDFDGDAFGSWPDAVPPGQNAPIRHWIVGNIPGELLLGPGYLESAIPPENKAITVLDAYRSPHIPLVSDRYGLFLFEQSAHLDFVPLGADILNFDAPKFVQTYSLTDPVAANYFVALNVSKSPFTGQPFTGNDVTKTWHTTLGQGHLVPVSAQP